MRNRRLCLALTFVIMFSVAVGRARASSPVLRLVGKGGAAFIVTAPASWRIDFAHAQLAGGKRYSGVALELLGRPANDGLTTMMARMPTKVGGSATATQVLGAADVTMPKGRYLMVLLGDGEVHATLPTQGAAVSRPSPTASQSVTFREGTVKATLRPAATGLYEGHLELSLAAMNDPLVMTKFVASFSDNPQAHDVTQCLRRGRGSCSEAADPSFGTGTSTTGGGSGTEAEYDYYDGYDGLGSGRNDLIDSVDYRGTTTPVDVYAAMVMVNGRNR